MAGHYDLKSSRLRLQIELRQVVQHVDGNARELDALSRRQFARPSILIHVASDGGNRRDGFKFLKNLVRANVPRVDYVFRLAQRLQCFRAKQAVRIGDDANQDGRSQFLALTPEVRRPMPFHLPFILSTNLPVLTTARPTVPRPISWTSSRAVTRTV